jgi:NADH-quinone oxidoreductase subunit I
MNSKKTGFLRILFAAIKTLLKGLKVTFIEFFAKKTTSEYPENRETLVMFDRFTGTLIMPDYDGHHRCTACGLCEINCPNNSIHIQDTVVTDETTGKKKKKLVKYEFDLSSCMFCRICVNVCPTDCIEFDQRFEHAVFNRSTLMEILNSDYKVVSEELALRELKAAEEKAAELKAEANPTTETKPKAESEQKAE